LLNPATHSAPSCRDPRVENHSTSPPVRVYCFLSPGMTSRTGGLVLETGAAMMRKPEMGSNLVRHVSVKDDSVFSLMMTCRGGLTSTHGRDTVRTVCVCV